MQNPKIIDIPVKMEKYFGKGTMLHPGTEEIRELLKKIPTGKVSTIKSLATYLAKTHGTDVTCPLRTGNAIKKISEQYTLENLDMDVPFWRVLRSDNMMVKFKDFEQWSSVLEDEGFELILTKSNNIKVKMDDSQVYSFF